jgi:hypothetical protein
MEQVDIKSRSSKRTRRFSRHSYVKWSRVLIVELLQLLNHSGQRTCLVTCHTSNVPNIYTSRSASFEDPFLLVVLLLPYRRWDFMPNAPVMFCKPPCSHLPSAIIIIPNNTKIPVMRLRPPNFSGRACYCLRHMEGSPTLCGMESRGRLGNWRSSEEIRSLDWHQCNDGCTSCARAR